MQMVSWNRMPDSIKNECQILSRMNARFYQRSQKNSAFYMETTKGNNRKKKARSKVAQTEPKKCVKVEERNKQN